MFFTYLRRELFNRRRQTAVVAVGLAVGISLAVTVGAISSGVKASQHEVLDSLYGVGTDISITKSAAPGDGPPRFEVGADENSGAASTGTRRVSRSRLRAERGAGTFGDLLVVDLAYTEGVETVTSSLKLTHTSFEGELPDFANDLRRLQRQQQQSNGGGQGQSGGQLPAPGQEMGQNPTAGASQSPGTTSETLPLAPSGGADGQGGAAFSVTSFSVLGINPEVTAVGPLSSVTVTDGVLLSENESTTREAVLDSTYAATEKISVGDTVSLVDEEFKVVGIVSSATSTAETAADVYIPMMAAKELSGVTDGSTNVYVKLKSGADVKDVVAALAVKLPEATISSSADLAAGISGSVSSASDLLSTFGRWLSIIVLLVAFTIAVLFTISGVSRRTREFGTLKALGWRNSAIVRQVSAESFVQGILGGVLGVGLSFGLVAVSNAFAPVLEATASSRQMTQGIFAGGQFPGGPPGGGGPFGGGDPTGGGRFGQSTIEVALHSSVTIQLILLALALSIVGGVLAGALGGFRAARLRPAESLRSI